ncbi:SDR family oxidoreductase [Bacillus cereus]|uniref:SDR family oxidoreductase n=1 Tax=Bacillus cereus TaxID=1396 RepID=UPI003F6BBD62
MILVTGATGNVGQEVVKGLIERNAEFQIATRQREKEGIYFDFENPSSFKPALTGITKLFLLRPPTSC